MGYKQRVWILVVASGLIGSSIQAADFKVRAREHFDQVTLTYGQAAPGQQKYNHKGIGPTINLWFEDPYANSFGLAVGMTYINNNGLTPYGTGSKDTELWSIGVEGKHYFVPKAGGFFFRWGLSSERVKAYQAFKDSSGNGTYLGLGYEIKFSRIGLALEAAKRQIKLGQQIQIDAQSPSIGVHFYGYL